MRGPPGLKKRALQVVFGVTQGRSFSNLIFEMPGNTANLPARLNGPLFSRKLTMAWAVLGPTPGNCCN